MRSYDFFSSAALGVLQTTSSESWANLRLVSKSSYFRPIDVYKSTPASIRARQSSRSTYFFPQASEPVWRVRMMRLASYEIALAALSIGPET